MNRTDKQIKDVFLLLIAAILLMGSSVEFFHIASGTGSAIGAFSLMWFVLFSVFVFLCLALWIALILWRRGRFSSASMRLTSFRNKMKFWRWGLAILVLAFPVWFLQYTMWGDGIPGGGVRRGRG